MEVQQADRTARRKALLLVVIAAIVGGATIIAFDQYRDALIEWLTHDPAAAPRRLRLALLVLGIAAAVPALGLSAHLWRIASRIRASGRFPPPGLALVRDTPVLIGPPAQTQARRLSALAILLAVLAFGMAAALGRLGDRLVRPGSWKHGQGLEQGLGRDAAKDGGSYQ